jgi:hypothetical protein
MNRDRGNFRWVKPGSYFDQERLRDLVIEINARSNQRLSILTSPFRLRRQNGVQRIEVDLMQGARTYRLSLDARFPPLPVTLPWRPIAVDEITKVEVLAARPGRTRRPSW